MPRTIRGLKARLAAARLQVERERQCPGGNREEHDRVPVKITWEHKDCPETPRDFNVDGSQSTLLKELSIDVKEFPEVKSYVAIDNGDSLWSVWRLT